MIRKSRFYGTFIVASLVGFQMDQAQSAFDSFRRPNEIRDGSELALKQVLSKFLAKNSDACIQHSSPFPEKISIKDFCANPERWICSVPAQSHAIFSDTEVSFNRFNELINQCYVKSSDESEFHDLQVDAKKLNELIYARSNKEIFEKIFNEAKSKYVTALKKKFSNQPDLLNVVSLFDSEMGIRYLAAEKLSRLEFNASPSFVSIPISQFANGVHPAYEVLEAPGEKRVLRPMIDVDAVVAMSKINPVLVEYAIDHELGHIFADYAAWEKAIRASLIPKTDPFERSMKRSKSLFNDGRYLSENEIHADLMANAFMGPKIAGKLKIEDVDGFIIQEDIRAIAQPMAKFCQGIKIAEDEFRTDEQVKKEYPTLAKYMKGMSGAFGRLAPTERIKLFISQKDLSAKIGCTSEEKVGKELKAFFESLQVDPFQKSFEDAKSDPGR